VTSDHVNPLLAALAEEDSNPLLAALPPKLNAMELASVLEYTPLTSTNVAQVPLDRRARLLDQFRATFVPTASTISIAYGLQDLLYGGLAARDPRSTEAKQFIYKSGRHVELGDFDVWWPTYAKGMIVEGITGMGKSRCVERFLELLPQVIKHGEEPKCGWKFLDQLVYLKLHMPADGSRGGFLTAAFLELDKSLGTDYHQDYSGGRWTIERQLVVFLHLLAIHRCGLLIIEEAQEKSLNSGAFSSEFMTLFLRVLNWGVPTVLVGNPLAFTKIKRFSQNVDRFSESGWHTLFPYRDHKDKEWADDWIPLVWNPTLLPLPDAPYQPASNNSLDQTLTGFIWRRTAGVPRYVARLRMAVQESALRRGLTQITHNFVDEIYRTDTRIRPLHARIEAITSSNWQALEFYEDIPASQFRKLMATELDDKASAPHSGEAVTPAPQKRSRPSSQKRLQPETVEEKVRESLMQGLDGASSPHRE
jgi:hypothetical protein